MYRAAIALNLIGAFILGIALALPFVFPILFDSQITKKLIIERDSAIMKTFQETPVPIYFQVWFFNVTNADDVIKGESPILDQVGPYTYRQQRQRLDIRWNDHLGTVIFKNRKYNYFERSLSYGPESQLITTIDPVFTSIAAKLSGGEMAKVLSAQILFLRFNKKPFMTHTVGELLFGGYDEPLLGELYKLSKDPTHARARSGFFAFQNGTVEDDTEIYSGQKGMSNYQSIFSWHGKTKLDFWKEERCNRINGTGGSQFARPIKTSERIYLFTAQLCRSIYAVFEKNVRLGPLPLYRFVLPKSLLDNSDENKCFCSSNFTCRASMIDVSPCRKGSPVVVSTPHFYQGDSEDLLMVRGLNPVKEEHETFLDIEPTTGVTMRAAKRIQLNMVLKPYGGFYKLSRVSELILPILWVNESVEVPMERVEKLYKTLTFPLMLVTYGSWALLGLGLILIFIAFLLTISAYKNSKKLNKRRQEKSDKKNIHNNILLVKMKNNV